MKKIITLVLAVILVASVGMTAFAAEGATGKITTPSGEEINLTLWDSFAAVPVGDGGGFFWASAGTAEIKASSNDANAKSVFYTTDETNKYVDAALNPTHSGGGTYADFVNNRGAAGINADTKAIVLRLKTDKEVLYGLNGNIWNEGNALGCQLAATGDPIWLVDADTSLVKVADIQSDIYRNTVVIPGGFDGFLVIPTSRIATAMQWDATTGTPAESPAAVGNWNSGALAGYVYFWQWYTYFQQTADTGVATIEVMDMYVVNSDLPTLSDGDYAEADISVIAYAAAAIAGLGALAIAKKR